MLFYPVSGTAPTEINFKDNTLVNPWWVAKEVCDILEYANSRDAVRKHVKPHHKSSVVIHDTGGSPSTIIDEAGLYTLILRSKMPEAEAFHEWIVDEVIPQIGRQRNMILMV